MPAPRISTRRFDLSPMCERPESSAPWPVAWVISPSVVSVVNAQPPYAPTCRIKFRRVSFALVDIFLFKMTHSASFLGQ